VPHDTFIEDDVPVNQANPEETVTSMVSKAANTSITQSTNAPEEIDEVELDTEAEIAYLQDLMGNEDSRIRNYARWGLNPLTNPYILKSKRHKSVIGKITKVATLIAIIIAIIMSIMDFFLIKTTEELIVLPFCFSSSIATFGLLLWLSWRTNNDSVIIDDVQRCSYCNMIIPKDGWFKQAFADKTPIKRHWKETNHLSELATTAAEMSGEKIGWLMKAKLNLIEND